MGYGFFAPGIVQGTGIFGVLTAIAAILAVMFAKGGPTTKKKEAKMMAFIVAVTSGVCMWMLYRFRSHSWESGVAFCS